MPDSLKVDWQVTVPVATEPLTPADFRSTTTGSYLRVDFLDDDTVLTDLIQSCRAIAEVVTGKSLAPQTLQVMYTMPQINAGALSGAKLLYDQDFYQYNETLGANPFSPAPFVLPMPRPPLVAVSLFEYRLTAFTPWITWPQSVNGISNYQVDPMPLPGVTYLQYPPPAYQYRLTYTAGYTTLPPELRLALKQFVAWKYDNRDAENMPEEIIKAFMGRKTWIL